MQILKAVDSFAALSHPRVLAAGFFDGVHRGHQRVIDAACAHAHSIGVQSWVMTFDRHPLSVLVPARRPPLLTSLEQRLERLEACALDGCLVLPFTVELAALSASDFLALLVGHEHRIKALFCGPNWRFGYRGEGTPEQLASLGPANGFSLKTVPALHYQGHAISSTRIRQAIRLGHIGDAAAMLGRPHTIRETVVRGRGLGRQIGSATANLHPDAEVLPPEGVYAVQTHVGNHQLEGVANLGQRPTFADASPDDPILELHLFDFDGDLYGREIDVAFIDRLRDEQRFSSAEALARQIRADIAQARKLLHAKRQRDNLTPDYGTS